MQFFIRSMFSKLTQVGAPPLHFVCWRLGEDTSGIPFQALRLLLPKRSAFSALGRKTWIEPRLFWLLRLKMMPVWMFLPTVISFSLWISCCESRTRYTSTVQTSIIIRLAAISFCIPCPRPQWSFGSAGLGKKRKNCRRIFLSPRSGYQRSICAGAIVSYIMFWQIPFSKL